MKKIFLGLDVSKGYIDYTVIDNNGRSLASTMRLPDNNSGYNSLIKAVSDLKKDKEVLCYAGMESTGGYETHWFNLLVNKNELFNNVYVFNGRHTKYYQKALNERNKTDAVSSQIIAEFIRTNHEKMTPSEPHQYHKYKKFLSEIQNMEKIITQNTNQLKQALYEYFPEFSSIMPDKLSPCHLLFLQKYPTRQSVLKANKKSLIRIPYIKHEFVDRLRKLCKETMLIAQPDDEMVCYHIKNLVDFMLLYQNTIDEYYKKLAQALPKDQIDLLCTIPGVGKRTAIGLLILTGNIYNFENSKKLAAYFGVHPVTNNSGIVEKSRMSKQGNHHARTILYHIVFQMFKQSSFFNPFLEELINKFQGKKLKAVGVMMHKICRIIWAMLTNNTPFDCERYIQDRKKRSNKHKPTCDDTQIFFKNNNLDHEDWVAPISNKMKKKLNILKKREPQDKQVIKYGVISSLCKNKDNERPIISQEFS